MDRYLIIIEVRERYGPITSIIFGKELPYIMNINSTKFWFDNFTNICIIAFLIIFCITPTICNCYALEGKCSCISLMQNPQFPVDQIPILFIVNSNERNTKAWEYWRPHIQIPASWEIRHCWHMYIKYWKSEGLCLSRNQHKYHEQAWISSAEYLLTTSTLGSVGKWETLSRQTEITLYKSLVISILLFGAETWTMMRWESS